MFDNKSAAGKKWWRLARPHTLTASIMPVLIGTAMSFEKGKSDLFLFLAMLFASLLIQSAVNMFNEYFDFKRGLDTMNSVGIGGVIVRNEISGRIVLNMAELFFAIAVLLGTYICARTNWWIAVAGSVSMLAGYLYSGGRSPIAYTPLGELTAGILMGPMIVVIAFYVQTGSVTSDSVILSLPISILVAAILLANNIRDADGDMKKGRRTLAILLGHSKATTVLGIMFTASFALVILFVLLKLASPSVLVSLASIPTAVKSIRIFRRKHTPAEMMPAMKASSALHSQFGLLFASGILLGKLLPFGMVNP
ncbi:MAG TPA: 1,4-dihydroxy-2-naphthoate polyprenyltransferase [Candidatus Acidoferrales bacterium]|nr:1,4-dihydroxy-2-naphthoate polyprenyltransferase [Candidatus Acidoferrales bacterium]